jgi:hypothetical protein
VNVAVVEQPPRGGGDVTIRRACYYPRVHLAVLRICDTSALDAAGRAAVTVRCDLLCMGLVTLCLYDTRFVCTIRVRL